MAIPIKITQVNRPLTCEEHDSNIDALLDRANHTGLQNCSTIEPTSLDTCISTSNSFTNLNTTVGGIDSRLTSVEAAIAGGGTIDQDLQNIRSELLNEIDQVEIVLNNHDTRITALELRADGFDSSIISINQNIDFEVGQLQSQITGNDNDIAIINTNINNLQNTTATNATAISNETANRITADSNILSSLNTEISNRIAGDTNIQNQLSSEISNRQAAVQGVQNNLNSHILSSQTDRNDIRNDFAAEDLALQAQIDALNLSLGTTLPPGSIIIWAGASIPSGWLLCNGQPVSRTTYAALFSRIGTTFGTTSSTNFLLPNFRDKFPKMHFHALQNGLSGGVNFRTLTAGQMPSHRHSVTYGSHSHTMNTSHWHHLHVLGHSHGGGGGGSHQHRLTAVDTKLAERADGAGGGYRPLVENSGRPIGGSPGPFGHSDDVERTDMYTTFAGSGGAISPASEIIRPPGAPIGINRTDNASLPSSTTSSTSIGTQNTTFTGEGETIDNQPAYLQIQFIIRT